MLIALIRANQRFGSYAARALGLGPLSYQSTIVELVADRDYQIEFYRFKSGQVEN